MAVKNNKPDTINQLLNLNCKFLENNASYKPIDYAIQFKLHEAAIAIVTHERGSVFVLLTTFTEGNLEQMIGFSLNIAVVRNLLILGKCAHILTRD